MESSLFPEKEGGMPSTPEETEVSVGKQIQALHSIVMSSAETIDPAGEQVTGLLWDAYEPVRASLTDDVVVRGLDREQVTQVTQSIQVLM